MKDSQDFTVIFTHTLNKLLQLIILLIN